MTGQEMIKKRVTAFLKDNIAAHIVDKKDGWYNGYIVKVYDDYFDFLDRKMGKVPLFFSDIRIFDFFQGDTNTLKKEGEDDHKSS